MAALNHDITEFLDSWVAGDEGALEKLTPLVYRELHRLAAHYMRREQPDHTLQATALVNETYVRLLDWNKVQFQNRGHFFGVMARLMRQILVDYARSGRCDKRGGGVRPLMLDESQPVRDNRFMVLLEIDEALNRLATIDAQRARVVELRYFGGLSIEETAHVVGVSPATVKRHWMTARVWLHHQIIRDERDDP